LWLLLDLPLHSAADLRGPRTGQPIFTPPTIAALLVYFAFALQCMATIGVMRRETGTWKWPAIAFIYLTALA
jgi:ferrous iron transport protein B